MDDMKKENIELRDTIQRRQETTTETESVVEIKPRPTSLYNIAQQYINSSNNSVVCALLTCIVTVLHFQYGVRF